MKYADWTGSPINFVLGKKLLSVSSNKGFSSFTSYVQQNLQKYKRETYLVLAIFVIKGC